MATVGHQFSYLAFTKSITLKVNLELSMYILGACVYQIYVIIWSNALVEFFLNFSSDVKLSIVWALYWEQFSTGVWDLTDPDQVAAKELIDEFSYHSKELSEAFGETTR